MHRHTLIHAHKKWNTFSIFHRNAKSFYDLRLFARQQTTGDGGAVALSTSHSRFSHTVDERRQSWNSQFMRNANATAHSKTIFCFFVIRNNKIIDFICFIVRDESSLPFQVCALAAHNRSTDRPDRSPVAAVCHVNSIGLTLCNDRKKMHPIFELFFSFALIKLTQPAVIEAHPSGIEWNIKSILVTAEKQPAFRITSTLLRDNKFINGHHALEAHDDTVRRRLADRTKR